MDEHLSGDLLGAYARRDLSPAELLAADDHLTSCHECRARLRGSDPIAAWASLRAGLPPSEAAEHLRYEELAAWVDGILGDVEKEIAGAHLEACPRCASEAEDLRGARAELRAGHEYRPSRRGIAIGPGAPAWSWWLRAAAVLALLAAGLWALRTQRGPHTARVQPVRPSPSAGASGEALADSGRLITLEPRGRVLGLEGFPAEVQSRVAAALSSRRVATADLTALGGPQQLMGPAGPASPFRLVWPVGTVVETVEPTLRWQPLAGASSYRVTLLDLGLALVAESPDLKEPAWRVPRALDRGRTYVWQVAARRGADAVLAPVPPDPDARFRVLDATRARAIAAARGGAESHLVLGVLYAEAGLLGEAEAELLALKDANPGSAVSQELLESLTRRRP